MATLGPALEEQAPHPLPPVPAARRRAVHRWVGIAALLALLIALFWLASARAVPGNSDGATVVLEGKAMAAGNLALHGWMLSLDSFWLVDAPLYALAVRIGGVRPELLNAIPAVVAAAVTILGAAMARRGRRGVAGTAGAVTVLALLGLPCYALSVFFLQGPLHVTTALWCLVAFSLLARPRPGRLRIAVGVALLAAGCLGDAQTLALGVLPVLFGGMLAMARRRSLAAGAAQVVAAAAAVALAVLGRLVALAAGTFSISPTNPLASAAQRTDNLRLAASWIPKLLGVGSRGFGSGGVPDPLALVHLAGLLAVVAGVLTALASLGRTLADLALRREPLPGWPEEWRLDDLLLLAFFADLALFVLLTPAPVVSYARYLTDAVVFGAILAGRALARLRRPAAPRWRPLPRVAGGLGLALVACFGASFGYELARSPAPSAPARLGRFLASHGLRRGLGDYWTASIVSVETGGHVRVRPVVATSSGRLQGVERNSSRSWYRGTFRFLVYRTAVSTGDVGTRSAAASFGPPARTYQVDGYAVLVYPRPVTVLPPS